MRGGLLVSLVFHAFIYIVAYLGIPYLDPEPLIPETPIFVEVVNVASVSNPPPPPPPVDPEPSEVKPVVRQAPLSQREELPVSIRKPIRNSEPEPKISQILPEPKPEPISKPARAIKAKREPEAKFKPRPNLSKIRPPRKPKSPDSFASVLKTLEAMEKKMVKSARNSKKKDLVQKKSNFEESIANALNSESQNRHNSSLPVSMSEEDAIKKHFQRCWNVPAGAKDAKAIKVELKIKFQQDGSVHSVKILNSARMRTDPFFRTSAEAAQRAVLHPKCKKLSMPPNKFPDWQSKYNQWQTTTLNFDPRDMF